MSKLFGSNMSGFGVRRNQFNMVEYSGIVVAGDERGNNKAIAIETTCGTMVCVSSYGGSKLDEVEIGDEIVVRGNKDETCATWAHRFGGFVVVIESRRAPQLAKEVKFSVNGVEPQAKILGFANSSSGQGGFGR